VSDRQTPREAGRVTEAAHAKINVILHILAREASGYHGIETLFQRLALHDDVTVTVHDGARALQCDGPSMPPGGLGATQDNLAWRAALLYCEAATWDTGFDILVHKRIPVGGGLGGGSADAAAVLRALERLNPAPLGQARLLELAGRLGADVAFLCTGASRAWAWGRGDRLLTLPPLPEMAVTLLTFREGVNTAAAYNAVAASRNAQGTRIEAMARDLSALMSWEQIASAAHNDFEVVVSTMHKGVAQALPAVMLAAEQLRAAGHPAIGRMSGSGATCFVLHPTTTTPSLPDLPDCTRVATTTA
jgi:4-diphosphocytidyl-2-C-methyl-D-erythritol kinase